MNIQLVHPASDSEALLSKSVQTFIRSCSSVLQSRTDISEMVKRYTTFDALRTVLALEDKKVIGWITVVAWEAGYATLHPLAGAKIGWPTVAHGANEDEVGSALLVEAAQQQSGTSNTLLMCIEEDAEISTEDIALLQQRYRQLGFHYTHLAHFCTPLESASPPSLRADTRIEPLKSADWDELATCILDAFSGPASPFFFGESPEERDQFVAGLLDSPASKESASSIVYVGNDLVGFVSTIGDESNLLVDWLGVRPTWQRRGLGALLLRHALAQGKESGYSTASGSANVANTASRYLLMNLGWKREGGERQFVLGLPREASDGRESETTRFR